MLPTAREQTLSRPQPPRQPKTIFAPDLMISLNTVSSARAVRERCEESRSGRAQAVAIPGGEVRAAPAHAYIEMFKENNARRGFFEREAIRGSA
jgi:hypothetical protein